MKISRTNTVGRNLMHLLKSYNDDVIQKKKIIVGGFGIVEPTGFKNVINWTVGNRKDRRHGVVDRPAPYNQYSTDLFNSMFRRWKNEEETK